MIFIRNWEQWQGRWLAEVRRLRKSRKTDPEAPYSLPAVRIASNLNPRFSKFAVKVGGAGAEAYFLRSLQYAGIHRAFSGGIDVDRELFGALVLSRPWDHVDAQEGGRIFDLLIDSGLCVRKRSRPKSGGRPAANRKPTLGRRVGDDPDPGPGSDPDPDETPLSPPRGGRGDRADRGRTQPPQGLPEKCGSCSSSPDTRGAILFVNGPKAGKIRRCCRGCLTGWRRKNGIEASRDGERDSAARRLEGAKAPRTSEPGRDPGAVGGPLKDALEKLEPLCPGCGAKDGSHPADCAESQRRMGATEPLA